MAFGFSLMKPTEILSQEHQKILKLIDVLLNECAAIESGKKLDKDFFEKVIDFIKNYADRFHHAKEENILFKELCKEGVLLHCNPVEQMLYEHDLGRNFVKGMEEGLNKNDKKKVVENARGYAQLLQEHIFKEDNVLYPMANSALNERIQKSILNQFKEAENKNKEAKKYLGILK